MAERNIGRSWTAHEDHLLINAVNQHGPGDNWKVIALSVPGRTNKACRKRWLHSLSPSIRKSAWTAEEDRRLLLLYATHGAKWSVIARQIPGRTDDACSKRYREALDPSLKKDDWTPEEDEKLMQAYGRLGGKWGQVGQELKRSGLGCRNRWRMLERRRVAQSSKPLPTELPSVFNTPLIDPPSSLEQTSINPWPSSSSFLMEQAPPPPSWPTELFHGNQPVILQSHPSSPSLSHGYSTAVTQKCSPHLLELPLEETPVVPPFRYSSSSLSAALSDAQTSQPSPSLNLDVPLDYSATDHSQSSLSSTPTNISIEIPLLEGNFTGGYSNCTNPDSVSLKLSDIRDVVANNHSSCGTSQSSRSNHYDGDGLRYRSSIPPISSSIGGSQQVPLACSSTSRSSTVLSISPISSPHSVSLPLDLPHVEQSPAKSMLFTTSDDLQPEQPTTSTTPKRSEQQTPTRLSSVLPVTSDPTVLPYACGYQQCYTSSTSISCFNTSKELSDHCKSDHPDRSGSDRPFRCGLDGCGKSWKSVNGLQYHLQISQAHFQHAISTSFKHKPATRNTEHSMPADEQKIPKKVHSCTHPQCPKVYRQLSGLRYHLLHGHPKDIPTQLHVVPPTLARRVAEKLRTKGLQTGRM